MKKFLLILALPLAGCVVPPVETGTQVSGCFEISGTQYCGKPDPSIVACERIGKSTYCKTLSGPSKSCFTVGGSLYCA